MFGDVKLVVVVAPPLQTTWLVVTTVAVGFTVYVKVRGVPEQLTPFSAKMGVTVIVAVTGAVPEFTAVNAGMLPVPLAPSPIDVLEFAHW